MANLIASARPGGRMPLAPTRKTGAWKLAYADFLTALCAFFLIMWLVHGVSGDQKKELARQFSTPTSEAMTSQQATSSGAARLAARLETTALLSARSANVALAASENAIRIDLIDLDRAPLFAKGNAALNQRGEKLIAMAASALLTLEFPVSIEGHTDSDPVRRSGYSNWELSADRANAARRGLVAAGLPESRIRSVAGLADTRPLDARSADLPQNRRLSIVIHLE